MNIGTYNAKEKKGWNIMPGWILIKKSADVAHFNCGEGYVHGDLTMSYFDMLPTELTSRYGAKF